MNIHPKKLQHTYSKHAADFGIVGVWNAANGKLLEQAIQDQVADPLTTQIQGTYRGTIAVTHYFDATTHVNVMEDSASEFVGGWKLSAAQISHLLSSGNVQ